MPDRDELGRRVKKAREERQMTLKAIEAEAGISATHVSEIERGKTSPTIGALLRIAKALRRDPSYFLEETELADVSLVTSESRVSESLPGGRGTMDRLTTSIPGGCLHALYVVLPPGGRRDGAPHSHAGEEAATVVSGSVRFNVDGESIDLDAGDSIQFDGGVEHHYRNRSAHEQARLVWVSTLRDTT